MTAVYDSDRTASVLLDLGARRREEEEKIVARGLAGVSLGMPDGLSPDKRDDARVAVLLAAIEPSWANGLLASALVATTAEGEEYLRKALLQVGSMAVAWIEHIDNRKGKEQPSA